MRLKFWIIFILVSLALGAVSLYYVRQPAPDVGPIAVHHATTTPQTELKDWKTYTNSEYGFSFQYPSTWEFSDTGLKNTLGQGPATNADGTWNFAPFVVIGNPLSGQQAYSLYVFVQANPKKLSASDYVSNLIQNAPQDGPGGLHFKNSFDLTVNSIPAYELDHLFAYDESNESIFLTNGDKAYNIQFQVADENSNIANPKENNAIAHKILATFKFTNSDSSATGTSGLKTYTSASYSFSLGYPSTWVECPAQPITYPPSDIGAWVSIWEIDHGASCNSDSGYPSPDVITIYEAPGLYNKYPTLDSLKSAVNNYLSKGTQLDYIYEVDGQKNVSIGGVAVLQLARCEGVGCGDETFNDYIYHDGRLLVISYYSGNASGISKEGNQILSTFKFTK